MRYSDELIDKYISLIKQKFGEDIDKEIANFELFELARLVEAVYKG